jgi:hypothetical protein
MSRIKFFQFAGHIGLFEASTGWVEEFNSIEECGKWVKAHVIGGKVGRVNSAEVLIIAAIKGWSF